MSLGLNRARRHARRRKTCLSEYILRSFRYEDVFLARYVVTGNVTRRVQVAQPGIG